MHTRNFCQHNTEKKYRALNPPRLDGCSAGTPRYCRSSNPDRRPTLAAAAPTVMLRAPSHAAFDIGVA
jgi:hypothetical protein